MKLPKKEVREAPKPLESEPSTPQPEKDFGNFGSIPIDASEKERLIEISTKKTGIIIAIKALSEQLGEFQLAEWKFWDRLRRIYDLPSDDKYRVWFNYYENAITYNKKEE